MDLNRGPFQTLPSISILGLLEKIIFYLALLNNSSFLWESIGSNSVAQFCGRKEKGCGLA